MARRMARSKAQVQAVLFLGGVVFMLLLGVVLFRPASAPSPDKILRLALRELELAGEHDIIIEESTSGHRLLFRGKAAKDTILTGILPDHELEVYHAQNGLYVREIGADEWEEARELKSLTGFLISPVELLRSQKENFRYAVAGQDIHLDGLPCRVVYLDLSAEEQLIKMLFPQIDISTIEAINLGVALDESGPAVKQIRLRVEFIEEGSLERAYYLEYTRETGALQK